MPDFSMELNRLEVLTGLIEFAKQQRAKGSPYTNGWADEVTVHRWQDTIGYLRSVIPKGTLKEFDNERQAGRHRENCQCMLCEEKRDRVTST